MTDQYDWADLRDRATRRYGEPPHGELEQDIIDVFRQHPRLVDQAIDQIGDRYDAGRIRKPWAVLRQHVVQAATPAEQTIRASDTTDRERAIGRALTWIANAGLHFDRWSEVQAELFHGTGLLRPWANHQPTVDRISRAWHEQRPRGEQVEREAEERATRYREQRQALAAKAKSAAAEPHDPEPIDDDDPGGPLPTSEPAATLAP